MGSSRVVRGGAEAPVVTFALVCLVGLAAAYAAALLIRPIRFIDADCWMHLAFGRYIWEHQALPSDTYFSFLTPPRPWPGYLWLFQTALYLLHSAAGYVGLLSLRAALFAAFAFLAWKLMSERPAGAPHRTAWAVSVTVVAMSTVYPRFFVVRPHIVSMPLLALFLFVLEHRPRRAGWLPLLAVVWYNLHGVMFPVVWLVTGAYAIEHAVQAFRGRVTPEARAAWWCFGLCVAGTLATPLGPQLLLVPFQSLNDASRFVAETTPVGLGAFTTFIIEQFRPSPQTFFNVFLLATILAAVRAVAVGRLRLSHLALLMCCGYLLSRGERFTSEFTLVALPLLAAHPPLARIGGRAGAAPQPVIWAMALMLLAMPLSVATIVALGQRSAYPMSTRGVPEGICAFLNRSAAGGKVLNEADTGGYLHWRLDPRYKIFMEMGLYFSVTDFSLSTQMFSDGRVLANVLREHEPTFLLAPLSRERLPELLEAYGEYRPIFFDDAGVLYANSRHVPELVERHELHALTPMSLERVDPAALPADPAAAAAMMKEAEQLLASYPEGATVNYLLGLLEARAGSHGNARMRAEAMIRTFPEAWQGHMLLGDALEGLGQSDGALGAYARAAQRARDEYPRTEATRRAWRTAHSGMGRALAKLGKVERAFTEFQTGLDPFANDAPIEDSYQLAMVSMETGREALGRKILTFLLEYRLAEGESAWRSRIQEALASR